LVVVFGYSDDSMIFNGAIHGQVDCWQGGVANLDEKGIKKTSTENTPASPYERCMQFQVNDFFMENPIGHLKRISPMRSFSSTKMGLKRMEVHREFELPECGALESYMYGDDPLGTVSGVPFYRSEYDFLVNSRAEADYIVIKNWVDTELMPFMTRKTVNKRHNSSYWLKHVAERELGFYVSSADIRYALIENCINSWTPRRESHAYYPINYKFAKRPFYRHPNPRWEIVGRGEQEYW